MNATKVAAALRALADAFEEGGATILQEPAAAAPVAAAAPKPRGRPPKAPVEPPAAPAPAPAAADPFEAAPTSPAATIEDVRAALTALKDATSQDTALGVLKSAGGAANLSSLAADKYAVVVAAAKAALSTAKPASEPDPFETEPATEAAKPATLEDVRAAIVAAQKRTSQDTVQKLVMEHGGKAKTENGYGPSLKALPADKYAEVIAAVNALPATK